MWLNQETLVLKMLTPPVDFTLSYHLSRYAYKAKSSSGSFYFCNDYYVSINYVHM